MNKKKIDRFIEATITGLSTKGNGRGPGVEVPFTMPGDQVNAKILRNRAGTKQCRLESIISPAPDRITPRCIHFGSCGGCRWQHMPYDLQLETKQEKVVHYFGDLITHDVKVCTILPCKNPWAYRNKMEYSFSSNAAGDKFLGLNLDGGRGKVLNLEECHLVNPWQIETLKTVKSWWDQSSLDAYHPYKNSGSLRTLILREGMRTGDRVAMLTVSGNPDYALHKDQIKGFVNAVLASATPATGTLSIFVRIQQIAKGMSTMFYEMHLTGPDTIREKLHIQTSQTDSDILQFKISPSAFFQPNTYQAEQLYSQVVQLANVSANDVVYDLYCGTGTIGICFAKYVKRVIGIELSPEAVLDARANAQLNGFTNVTTIGGAVGEVLSNLHDGQPLPLPDLVIVDPPRAGLEPEAIKQLIALNAKKIVYISCNPVTQAANCADLIQNGYRLQLLQPVDQFPQTAHIENIALLIRD